MFKTNLSFNVLQKRVSLLHQNNPGSFLPKDRSFTAYCVSKCTSTKIYTYKFVHMSDILSFHIFGPCSSVRVPLSTDRSSPLSPNSVLHVRSQISNERPPPFILGLFCSPQSCFITLIQDCNLNLSITHSSLITH